MALYKCYIYLLITNLLKYVYILYNDKYSKIKHDKKQYCSWCICVKVSIVVGSVQEHKYPVSVPSEFSYERHIIYLVKLWLVYVWW